MRRYLRCFVVICTAASKYIHVRSCIATQSPEEPGSARTSIALSRSESVPSSAVSSVPPGSSTAVPVTNADCTAWCPSTYQDNCYGTPKMTCATAAQAAAMVASTGTQCRETWTCPVGTQPYYYAYGLFGPQAYPAAGNYALCNAPPGNFWRLPDGVTEITAVTCESAT